MFHRQFPDVEISDRFVVDFKRVKNDFAVCESCKGLPCKRQCDKGFKPFVTAFNGGLTIHLTPCPFFETAKRQNAAKRQFNMAKIPPMYVGKTFEDYQIDAGNKNAVGWARRFEPMYLFGEPGTGKTFLAAIMAQELLKQGKSVIFGDVPTLLDQLKGTFDKDSEATLEQLMKTLSEVDVLILDDLGTETPTEWAVERLYLIINNRYNAGKSVIVTSNYAPDAAKQRLNRPKNAPEGVTGSRIISRLSQICRIVKIGGTDRRLKPVSKP